MSQLNEKSRKRKSIARDRIEKRKQRREAISNIASEGLDKLPAVDLSKTAKPVATLITIMRDTLWRVRRDAPLGLIAKAGGGFIAVVAIFFVLMSFFSNEIGPNITTMGIKLSGQTIEEASETLFAYWNDEATIDVLVEDTVFESVRPSEIGLFLDVTATAEAAKAARLSGFPFGHEIEPVISSDYGDIQTYILSIGNQIYIPAREAGYAWENGTLVSVQGSPSRDIDVTGSIQRIFDNPLLVVETGSVSLITVSTAPNVIEADPYYQEALAFVTSDFIIEGYDPFRDQTRQWATTRQEMASWLVVTDTGLSIQEDPLEDFVTVVNSQLDVDNWRRYLDPAETYEAINSAFVNDAGLADVRIRYADSTYTLGDGDWGIRLSRRLGLPFFNIRSVNPGIDWDGIVYPGQNISVPSRDLVIPLEPIEDRRIVVDLDSRYLVAFENDEVVFDWPISIGRTDAPTIPGVYQILSKVDIASGSSFALCTASACGQWEMDHFMGIYEVSVGLTNGFHGTVRLPNGGVLTQGSTQSKSTFGCVMSDSEQAQLLYEWAETGIVVELLDVDFPPESALGQRALDFIRDRT
ncbi:MAG: L,D-transpeptidase family protein [Phototrophicaceae bacterium]